MKDFQQAVEKLLSDIVPELYPPARIESSQELPAEGDEAPGWMFLIVSRQLPSRSVTIRLIVLGGVRLVNIDRVLPGGKGCGIEWAWDNASDLLRQSVLDCWTEEAL